MKRILLIIICASLISNAFSQVKQGKIVYERKSQLQIQIDDPSFRNMLPKERKDKFELLFADNKTLWRATEEQPEEMSYDNGGAQIRIITPGSNDVLFSDLSSSRVVEQREVMTKQFTIEDSIHRFNWKMGNETRDILGYTCRKATTTRTTQSQRVTMDNGEMNRQMVTDTLQIVAWFTDAIALPAGPESYQGQLPGTILELDINNGRTTLTALEVSPKVDSKEIKEPKGKKITREEFAKERDKMFKEMQQNGGGNMNIKVGN